MVSLLRNTELSINHIVTVHLCIDVLFKKSSICFMHCRRFQWNVNLNQSSVKIASSLDRSNEELLAQLNLSVVLDPVFKENLANDPFIR